MLVHPSTLMDLAHDRQRNLTADADRWRLLSLARRARKPRSETRAEARADTRVEARAGRGHPAGTLSACERSVAVPAR